MNCWVWIAICVVCIAAAVWMWLRFRRLRSNVGYMLDAVEAGDFAFRYSTGGGNRELNQLISLLERITDSNRQKEQYFELILNSVETGIVVVRADGAVTMSNARGRRLLHCPALSHIAQLDRVNPSLKAYFQSSDPEATVSLTTQDGSINLSVGCAEMSLHGAPTRIYSLIDISKPLQRKEIESWERLTRVLAHEIMNSMTPIVSLSDSLASDPEATPAQLRQGLATISDTGRSLMDFVKNYRSYANVPTPQPTLFYAKPFAERLAQIAHHQYPEARVDISIVVEPADLIIYADEALISQAVSNLLKNAVEACGLNPGKTGKITLKATVGADEAVRITVANDGPLIAPEEAEQIFLPFFTTRAGGSGIGLALARRIAQLSGGSLTLRTRPMTQFTLTLP
ncbi:MAG: GHKL domain-containing protein [Bacteroidales bacterium]|nr:GHKL domain-containing protein [Bacteroidales bacterium]